MTVTIVQLGQTKDKKTDDLCREFEARLTGKWKVSHIVLKCAYLPQEPSEKEIERALEKEAEELLSLLEKHSRAFKIALAVEGKLYSSEEFAALLGERMHQAGEFLFLIGSSHGLAERVKRACDVRLSLSRMTLPHELCRLVFTEQLYRAHTILSGQKYHK